MIDYGRYRYKLAISNLPKKNSKLGIIIYALLINIGPIMHSLADIWQKPFFYHSRSPKTVFADFCPN